MNINKKIISYLVFSFLLISIIFTFNSINSLSKNQKENITLFKSEFLELHRELFENNSNIFFNGLNTKGDAKIESQTILDYTEKAQPPNEGKIFIINISDKKILDKYKKIDVNNLFTDTDIDKFLHENTLNQKIDFEIENFDKFESDITNTIIPSKVHFRIYANSGYIVCFFQSFSSAKVRIEFIERQNKAIYDSQLYLLIIISISTLIFIIIFMTIVMKKIILNPLEKILFVVNLMTAGDLNKRVEINSSDEIGQLGLAFNGMTEKLQILYSDMDNKVKEKTQQLSIKVKELDDQNKSILNMLNKIEESK